MSCVRLPGMFLLCALLALAVQTDSWPQCQTPVPYNKPGTCIPIERCEPILTLNRQYPYSHEARQYAHQSQCGYNQESRYPSVCCPNDGIVPANFKLERATWSYRILTVPTVAPSRPTGGASVNPFVHTMGTTERSRESNQEGTNEETIATASEGNNGSITSPSSHPNARLLPTDICGLDYSQRIFGGNATDLDEFPWTALLQYENRGGLKRYLCGGVLINKRYVLTAAHCTSKGDLKGFRPIAVRLGEHNTATEMDCVEGEASNCADPPLDFGIEKEIVHPDYKYWLLNKHDDIALIRLSSDVPNFTDYIRPICIPLDPEVTAKNYVGKNLTVTGWGRTEEASSSPVKMKANLPVVANAECAQVYEAKRKEITDKQICAGGMRERDVCKGDSGGPMMSADLLGRDKKIHYHVTGIVSHGPSCSLSEQNVKWSPGVYTRVSQYSTWILDQLKP